MGWTLLCPTTKPSTKACPCPAKTHDRPSICNKYLYSDRCATHGNLASYQMDVSSNVATPKWLGPFQKSSCVCVDFVGYPPSGYTQPFNRMNFLRDGVEMIWPTTMLRATCANTKSNPDLQMARGFRWESQNGEVPAQLHCWSLGCFRMCPHDRWRKTGEFGSSHFRERKTCPAKAHLSDEMQRVCTRSRKYLQR